MKESSTAQVPVDRVGTVTLVERRRNVRDELFVRLVAAFERSTNNVLIYPARIRLAEGVVEGSLIRVVGTTLPAVDPLVPAALVAAGLTVIHRERHGVS